MNEQDLKNIEAPSEKTPLTPFQKKRNAAFFTLFSCTILLVVSVVILLTMTFIFLRVLLAIDPETNVSRLSLFVIFAAGMFVSFKLYTFICRITIKGLKLQNKLPYDVVKRYLKDWEPSED